MEKNMKLRKKDRVKRKKKRADKTSKPVHLGQRWKYDEDHAKQIISNLSTEE